MKTTFRIACLLAALTTAMTAALPVMAQNRVNLGSQVNGTLPVTNGGTGTTTATGTGAVVRTNSPTITSPVITGGSLDNTVIGATTKAAGSFSTLTIASGGSLSASVGAGSINMVTTGAGTIVLNSGSTGSMNNMTIGNTNSQNVTGTTVKALTAMQASGYFQGTTPTNVTASTYSATGTDNYINFNVTATTTLTLPTATAGRMLWLRSTAAFAINSATANVLPMGSTTAGTAILAATAGKWALLVGNGTNWTTMAAN
ncbi:MAG: hypothetical protein ABI673_01390 [Novosphingobium sp.]